MEDLSKHQLILLTLLVTFVMSVATSIITFTLLQEAPVEVTQNINRIVERTIERVVTEENEPEKIVTTVVVNEEDRILEAIAKNEKSIVRLQTLGADGSPIITGLGLVVSSKGLIMADLRSYSTASTYNILFYDGKTYPTGKIFVDDEHKLAFINISIPKNDNSKYVFYPAAFGNSDDLKIGQTLVAISGRESNAASIGRVFQLALSEDKKTVTDIFSDIKISKSHPGSPAFNLSGEIVGLEEPFAESDTQYSFMPINVIKAATTKALAELAR